MSCVDLGVVGDKYVGIIVVRIMCYSDTVLCFLWIFIYKVHTFMSWLKYSTHIYTAGIDSLEYDKMYSSYIFPIYIKTLFIHGLPPR